jgi:hypothetical protein
LTHRDANRNRKGKNSREFEAFSRCPRTPGQTPTATELASPHTAGPQTPPITAEFLPVSFPSVLPPSVLRSSLHVSTDCTPRTGALVERLRLRKGVPGRRVSRPQPPKGGRCPYYEHISEGSISACGHRLSSSFSEPAAGRPTPNDCSSSAAHPGVAFACG